jgi:DNA-binding NtrC family response regulator
MTAVLREGFMNPAIVLRGQVENKFKRKSATNIRRTADKPAILIATIDPEIREGLVDLLQSASVNAIWVGSVEDVKTVVAKERIDACLCGFWLQDGTYREVIHHLRRERLEIPAIIVPAAACPQEYRDYLAAMNLGALDFLCHPYQKSDFERMLESAIAARSHSVNLRNSEKEQAYRQRRGAA